MIVLGVAGYMAVLLGIGAAVNYLLVPIFGRSWRLFVAPGVIIHELAHVLGCIATGAKVLEINFWKPSGGHVAHTQPEVPIIGPVVVSLAPTIVMTIGLFILAPLLSNQLTNLAWVQYPPSNFTDGILGYFTSILAAFNGFNWASSTPWLLVYLMLNVAVTITPSAPDFHNSKWALGALVIVIGLAVQVLAVQVPLSIIWPPIATSLILLGMALAVAAVLALIAGFFRGR